MCLLVVRKKGNWLPSTEEIRNAWESNPDGFGLAYAKEGQIWVAKTLKRSECESLVAQIPDEAPLLLHWRFGTHGSKTEANCHPFSFLGGHWIGAHNGVLSGQPCLPDKTDSESYLLGLTKKPNAKQIEADIARLGGASSKIACLSTKGEIVLANEYHGDWRLDDVWQSNTGLDGWGSGSPLLKGGYWSKGYARSATSALTRAACWYCDDMPDWQDEDGTLLCDRCAENEHERSL